MVLMAAAGLDNDEIAACLDTRREVVSKAPKRFFEQGLPGLNERPRGGRLRSFPPEVVAPSRPRPASAVPLGRAFSRLHVPDIISEVVARGIVADISGTTIWRWCQWPPGGARSSSAMAPGPATDPPKG